MQVIASQKYTRKNPQLRVAGDSHRKLYFQCIIFGEIIKEVAIPSIHAEGHAERIALYQSRAAKELPLFTREQ